MVKGSGNDDGKKNDDSILSSLGFLKRTWQRTRPLLNYAKNFFAGPHADTTPDSFFVFVTEFISHGMIGLIIGAAIDRLAYIVSLYVVQKTTEGYKDDNDIDGVDKSRYVYRLSWGGKIIMLFLGFLQLTVDLFVLFALTIILPGYVYRRWQGTIPGLAFPSLFFGIQSTLFNNIQAIMR